MNQDITERLRIQAKNLYYTAGYHICDLLMDAVKEIENLRAEVKKTKKTAEELVEKGYEDAYQIILAERKKFEKSSPAKEVFQRIKQLRKLDEETLNEFKNIVTIDEKGNSHEVPVIWGDDEKAGNFALKADKIRLPLMNLCRNDIVFISGIMNIHYTLTASSLYEEDMNQILEQVISKFHPTLVKTVSEHGVLENYYDLTSITNNKDINKDDNSLKVIKYRFNLIFKSRDFFKKE